MSAVREGTRAVTACAGASEDLCQRCGRCCRVKLAIDGEVVATPFLCPHLDRNTRLCTIYERRSELNPFCVSAADGVEVGVFPADCPYVSGVPGYQAPRDATPDEIAAYAHACVTSQLDIRRIAEEREREGVSVS